MAVVQMDEPFKRKIALLRDVMEADVYISVPKMKTHGLTMISGAMKNNYGLLAGAQKSWFHYYSGDPKRFARVVVELFRMRPPDFVIMDAILAMEGYGPASPETRWVNKILAATDAVALDTVEAKIVGFTVDDVPYLKIARELGLGETDLNAIEVVGKTSTIQEYHRPVPPESSYSYKAGVGSGWTNRDFFRTRVAYRPVFSSQKCNQECKACVEACPSGALTREPAAPLLDSEKCMLCTACRESCDHEAIRLEPDEKILSLIND
jgi:ferredoxin